MQKLTGGSLGNRTAIKAYGYDPRAGRSGIPRQIADDLGLAGLALDEDTIRKYLNEAKELLPLQDARHGVQVSVSRSRSGAGSAASTSRSIARVDGGRGQGHKQEEEWLWCWRSSQNAL